MNQLVKLLVLFFNLGSSAGPFLRAGLGLGSLALVANTVINELWAALFSRVDGLLVESTGGAVDFSALSFANYIFPFDTMFTLLIAYGSLRLACAGIRIIKSFIPTVA